MSDIAKLRDDVTRAKEAIVDAMRPKPSPLSVYRHDDPMRLAWEALYEAEQALSAAEEAAKRPRLRTAREHAEGGMDRLQNHWYGVEDIERFTVARDAEWMAAIRKLPMIDGRGEEVFGAAGLRTAFVALSDIEALTQETKP